MTNFENGAFQPCKEWIAEQIDSGKTWEGVKAYGEDEANLNMLKDDELFPLEMTPEMWTEFVEYYRSIVVSVQIVDGEDVVAIDKGGLSNTFGIPSGYSSTWESYKNFLGNRMSPDSIANLQKSCLWILNHLSTDTRISGEVKGLVKINECYRAKSSAESEGTASKLSGKLGRRLLPTLSFGKKKGGFGGSGGAGGSGETNNNLDCILRQSIISADSMMIEFELRFKNIRREAFIGVFVESEIGLMDAYSWKTGIGTVFPIEIPIIANCSVLALNSKQMLTFDSSCTKENRYIENDFSMIEVVYTEDGDALGFKVTNTVTNAVVKGTLTLKSRNKKYCCTVKEAKEPVV